MLHYRLHRDPKSSHQQIAALLRRLRPQPILDVGAAQGLLGQMLQDDGLVLDAVEPNAAWAEHARPWYRQVYAATIEGARLPAHTYAAVVCADVLEHTVDPQAVLSELRAVAAADAWFVVSLPNVAHIAVRLLLLAGLFPKMDRGILDRTHLHFYTRATARELLAQAGLQVQTVRPTGFPLDELWPRGEGGWLFALLQRAQHLLLLLAPTVFAWQWVLVARAAAPAPANA